MGAVSIKVWKGDSWNARIVQEMTRIPRLVGAGSVKALKGDGSMNT
jgi:hypothetical protein